MLSADAPVEIRRLAPGRVAEESAWDAFVRISADGTAFHLTTWRQVVEEAFKHRPHYLYAVRDGAIRAVLPLFEIRGLLSGHVLVSVPYGVYGGLCGEDSPARRALVEEARRLAIGLRVRHVEFRHLHGPEAGLATKSLYVTFVKALSDDPDANLGAVPAKRRRMIRQGMKHGLEGRRGWEVLDGFYGVYLANRRHLGSPPFPLRLFEGVRDRFGKDSQLLTIWHRGRMVGGVISLFHEGRVMPYFGASLPEAFSLAANDFMYWELMRDSSLAGYGLFDFGRSRQDAGSYHFKRHWGFQPTSLSYQYLPVRSQDIPNVNPSSPRWRPFIETWKWLPLRVTEWIGPPLTRWLPLD